LLAGGEFFAHGFHFGEGVLIAGAVGGGDAFVQAGQCVIDTVHRDHGLRGHLVGGDVVGIARDAGGEFGEGGFGIALRDVLHGQAVTGECVRGIELEDFVEGGELVHRLIVWG
jgi:hypothetical protein